MSTKSELHKLSDIILKKYSCSFLDPCQLNNGGCAHTCVVEKNKNGTPIARCPCPGGYYLRSDGNTCVGQ